MMNIVNEMSTFEHAVLFCLKNEDDSWRTNAKLEDLNDGAGWTFIGLTQRYDGDYLKAEHGLNIIGLYELYKVDKAHAIQIIVDCYKKKYWDGRGFDAITSPRIAIRLFDLAVNCGFGGLNDVIKRSGLGRKFEPETINATVAEAGEESVLHTIKAAALDRYKALKGWSRFGNGWTNRLNKDEFVY